MIKQKKKSRLKRTLSGVLVLSISLDTFYSNKNYAARKI